MNLLNDINAFLHEKLAPRERTVWYRRKRTLVWSWITFFLYLVGVPVGLYFLGYLNVWLWFALIPYAVVVVFWFWFNAWYESKYL